MKQQKSATEISRCIADNLFYFSRLAGQIPGGTSYDGQDVSWVRSGTAAMNRVFAARFAPEETERKISEIAELYGGEPITWIVGPNDQPENLGANLLSSGFTYHMRWIGMAFDLANPVPQAIDLPDFEIIEARTVEQIRQWGQTAAAGFAMPPAVVRDFPKVFADYPSASMHYLLGFHQGQPVATASLCCDAEAGAYFITTLPEARRRGFAREMTLALLREARLRGCRLVVLEASPAGYEVYQQIGFQVYCSMDIYNLLPTRNPQ